MEEKEQHQKTDELKLEEKGEVDPIREDVYKGKGNEMFVKKRNGNLQ